MNIYYIVTQQRRQLITCGRGSGVPVNVRVKYPVGSSCALQSVDAIMTTNYYVQKKLRSARKRPGSIPGRIVLSSS